MSITLEEFVRESKRMGKSKEETIRKAEELSAKGYFASKSQTQDGATDDKSTIDKARGYLSAFNRGITFGGSDEVVAGLRAAIDEVVEQFNPDAAMFSQDSGDGSLGKRYDRYLKDERNVRDEFAEENPVTATALEIGGAIASPVNRVGGASLRGATGLQRAVSAGGRGFLEGGAYGFLEGEGGFENRFDKASDTAAIGAGFGAGMSAVGGLAGRLLSKERVPEEKLFVNGKQVPLNMADPEGSVGGFTREYLGKALGSRGLIKRQESRAINANPRLIKLAKMFGIEGDIVPETVGTGKPVQEFKDKVLGEIDVRKSSIEANKRIQSETRQRAAEQAAEAKRVAATRYEQVSDKLGQSKRQVQNKPIPVIDDLMDANLVAMRKRQAAMAVPDRAPESLKRLVRESDNPQQVADALDGWWQNNGFSEVKKHNYILDEGDLKKLARHLDEDEIALLSKKAKDGRVSISGDDLLEIRNRPARESGRAGDFKRGQLRQTVNEIDSWIEDVLQRNGRQDAWDDFLRDKDIYGEYKAYVNAVDKTKNGLFNEGHLITSLPNRLRRYGKTRTAENYRIASQKRKEAKRLIKAESEAKKQALQDVQNQKIAASRQRAEQVRAADAQKRAVESEVSKMQKKLDRQKRRIAQVKKAAANRIERETRGLAAENAGPIVQIGATSILGLPLGNFTPAALPAGIAVAEVLGSQAGQRAIAGQTGLQKALRKAIENGDSAMINAILLRIGLQQGSQE